MYRDLGQLDEARAALEEAIVLAPENPDHLFNVGVIDLETQRLERAEQLFEQVLTLRPDYTLALLNLGYIAKMQGRLDEAEARYKRAVECDQKGVEARANLAHLLVDQERYEDALILFEDVRSLESGLLDIELGYLVSLVHQPQPDWSACRVVLHSLEALLSDWTVEEGDLGRSQSAALRLGELGVLLIRNEMHKCAELALRAAVALQEGLLDMRRLLAEVLFARGGYWQAVAQLEIVLQAEPQDAASFNRLGDCYKQLGVEDAAQMCYARAGGV
jgi:Tfp pilus assembly protein PilF